MLFRSERLDVERHDLSAFSCGEPSLDCWLREQSVPATAQRTARTWVWVDQGGAVAGYYALAAHKVARETIPAMIRRGGPAEIPAVLLARIVDAPRTVAARLVVVDALYEQVARFYESLGFRRTPGSLLLVQKIADIEAALQLRP